MLDNRSQRLVALLMVSLVVGCGSKAKDGKPGDSPSSLPATAGGKNGTATVASTTKSGSSGTERGGDESLDFSKVDYSLPDFSKVDYTKGPQGEVIEELIVAQTGNDPGPSSVQGFVSGMSVSRGEAKWRALRQDALRKADAAKKFVRHGTRTVWWKVPKRPSAVEERRLKDKKQEPPVYSTESGVKYQEESWLDGKLHGPVQVWDKSGKLLLELFYVNGQRHGKKTAWWPSGQKKVEDFWLDGKQHGIQKGWHENGQQSVVGAYVEGKEHGKWRYWHQNGQKQQEVAFLHGVRHGVRTDWHENGQKKVEVVFVEGKEGQRQEWDKDGNDLTKAEDATAKKYQEQVEALKQQVPSTRFTLAVLDTSLKKDTAYEDFDPPGRYKRKLADAAPGSKADLVQALSLLYGEELKLNPGTAALSPESKAFYKLKFSIEKARWTKLFGPPERLSEGYEPFLKRNYGRWRTKCTDGSVTFNGNIIEIIRGKEFYAPYSAWPD